MPRKRVLSRKQTYSVLSKEFLEIVGFIAVIAALFLQIPAEQQTYLAKTQAFFLFLLVSLLAFLLLSLWTDLSSELRKWHSSSFIDRGLTTSFSLLLLSIFIIYLLTMVLFEKFRAETIYLVIMFTYILLPAFMTYSMQSSYRIQKIMGNKCMFSWNILTTLIFLSILNLTFFYFVGFKNLTFLKVLPVVIPSALFFILSALRSVAMMKK